MSCLIAQPDGDEFVVPPARYPAICPARAQAASQIIGRDAELAALREALENFRTLSVEAFLEKYGG